MTWVKRKGYHVADQWIPFVVSWSNNKAIVVGEVRRWTSTTHTFFSPYVLAMYTYVHIHGRRRKTNAISIAVSSKFRSRVLRGRVIWNGTWVTYIPQWLWHAKFSIIPSVLCILNNSLILRSLCERKLRRNGVRSSLPCGGFVETNSAYPLLWPKSRQEADFVTPFSKSRRFGHPWVKYGLLLFWDV